MEQQVTGVEGLVHTGYSVSIEGREINLADETTLAEMLGSDAIGHHVVLVKSVDPAVEKSRDTKWLSLWKYLSTPPVRRRNFVITFI